MNDSTGHCGSIGDIVDLERYPIDDLDALAGRQLISRCRREFADDVSCRLPGFIKVEALRRLVADIESRERRAVLSSRYRSPYGFYRPEHGEAPEGLSEGDPRTTPQRRHVHYLAYDEFAADSLLHRLYESPELAAFAARVLNVPAIYPAADKLMAAPVTFHYQGSELGWHCDTQEFTITALFRESASGGVFQYVPAVGPGDANFDRVPEVLAGDVGEARTVVFEAGDILLFRGANTLHRVTPTGPGRPRLLAVLHYERKPGRIFDDQFKLDVFGRTA